MLLLLSIRVVRITLRLFRERLSNYVFSSFPFLMWGRIWDLIVFIPEHRLFWFG